MGKAGSMVTDQIGLQLKEFDLEANFEIVEGDPENKFNIDFKTGTLYTRQNFDREKQDSYQLQVRLLEQSRNSVASVTVFVNVQDENDNPPVFQNEYYSVNIEENLPSKSTVLRVEATDADIGNNAMIKYSIVKVAAKSSILLDVKPWDDETNMAEVESNVRTIECDGLLWGASKLVPIGYGIKKLQISCVIEDDK